jgi:hypothetical protein
MQIPNHIPVVAAVVAAGIGGASLLRPQTVTVAPQHMVAAGPQGRLDRDEPRDKCEAACAHLREIHCSLGSSLYCVPALQDGTTPLAPHVTASCEQIAAEDKCP